MPQKKRAFIGLGSNLGERRAFIKRAIEAMAEHPSIGIKAFSSLYESRPVGFESSFWFLNGVLEIETELGPEELMSILLDIEERLGRDRAKGMDRTIDLDLLYLEGESRDGSGENGLVLPHPRFFERDFVLLPWAEIAPDFFIKEYGLSVRELLERRSVNESEIYRLED